MKLKENLYSAYGKMRQIYRMKKGCRFCWHNDRISVVFLMQYTPSWGKLELLYDSLIKKPEFDVHLVCVPDNLNNGVPADNMNQTYQYFTDKGYEAVDAWMGDGR